MAKGGKTGPKPYAQHQAQTLFLRVSSLDWPAVRGGRVSEFVGLFGQTAALFTVTFPTPVVAYSVDLQQNYDSRLMILEGFEQEPLGICAKQAKTRFGMPNPHEFRRYWMRRTNRKFTPTRIVNVYRVRAVTPDDYDEMGRMLLNRLFGDWL